MAGIINIVPELLDSFGEEREEENKDESLFQFFHNFVNILEGIKTQVKNVHWASLLLPNSDKRGAHLYLDDFLEVVEDFQDKIAECAMGITGVSFKMNTVYGTHFEASCTKELMDYVQRKALEFYNAIPETAICAGIKSETEVFILNINQYVFRFKLTE